MGSVVDRSILHSLVYSGIFLFTAKAVGAIKEAVVANAYGISTATDAYSISFAIFNWPVAIGAASINAILVPYFVKVFSENCSATVGAGKIALKVLYIGLSISAIMSVILYLFVHKLIIDVSLSSEILFQMSFLVFTIPIGLVSSVLVARLIASRRQIGSLLEAIPSLVVMIGIFLFDASASDGFVLAMSTLLGFSIYLISLISCDFSAISFRNARRIDVKNVRDGVFLVITAQVVFSFGGSLLDQLIASSLDSGANSTLSYASRLIMLATGLAATAIGRTILPVMSAHYNDQNFGNFVKRWSLFSFLFGCVCVFVGMVFSNFIVSIIFERGQFTSADTAKVSSVLQASLLQLPFYFSSLILSQALVARRMYRHLLVANLIPVLLKMLVIYILISKLGIFSILAGTVAMYVGSMLLLTYFFIAHRNGSAVN